MYPLLLLMVLLLNQTMFAQSMKKSIKKGKAKSVETTIKMVAGDLILDLHTDLLLKSSYTYKKDRWKPEISYEIENGEGLLNIISTDSRLEKNYDDDDNSNWNISLNKDIRQKLNLKIGAGEGNIDLSNSNLEYFECNMAAGKLVIDLSNTSVPDVELNAIASDVTIDLSGKWKNDLHAEMHGGVGELLIYVPKNVGVKLEIRGILGEVDAKGFHKEGRFFMNEQYEKTDETLYIYVFGGLGEVQVKMK